MRFAADLHIHSHFSLATSRQLTPEQLDCWARIKGLSLIGTGDFTHPGWIKELKEKLDPAEPGLFRLKPGLGKNPGIPESAGLCSRMRFVLSAEISNIYKKYGRVRKVHSVILAPDFKAAEDINRALLKREANLSSDGRPILGMDVRGLLETALESSPDNLFIPAHIWTPWFSILGSKSGFDSVEECFEDLVPYIHAVETGLSTDPAMNAICSFLDPYTLLSNSDAHSPEKLARNANLFDCGLNYYDIKDGITGKKPEYFLGTVDLYPQEGKYHYDGHRKCGVRWNPLQTLENQGVCPQCGRSVTVGVMNRVAQLADRGRPESRPRPLRFHSIIPLKEILSEIHGVGPGSKTIHREYMSLIHRHGPELSILLDIPEGELRRSLTPETAEAVIRMRRRRVIVREGFDGEFGKITVYQDEEFGGGPGLFGNGPSPAASPRPLIPFDLNQFRRMRQNQTEKTPRLPFRESFSKKKGPDYLSGLNEEQRKAVLHTGGPALIQAGPGTGKTRTLTAKIAHLVQSEKISPESILAVTFTNKAAREIKTRLQKQLRESASRFQVFTFHALGYSILKSHCRLLGRTPSFSLLDEWDRESVLKRIGNLSERQTRAASRKILRIKQRGEPELSAADSDTACLFRKYQQHLKESNHFDIDDCLYQPLRIFDRHPDIRNQYRKRFLWILVDEYQDINRAQYMLIRTLAAGKNPNLVVIGDPNQAIYGFRGADAGFIQKFQSDFPEAEIYSFRQSFRCSNIILAASQSIAASSRLKKMEGREHGVRITFTSLRSDKSEAEYIARTIEDMIGGLRFFSMDSEVSAGYSTAETQSLSDFAVLCRTYDLMDPVKKAFSDHSIPFQTVFSSPFTRREPFRSLLDIFKQVIDPSSPASLKKTDTSGKSSLDVLKSIIPDSFPSREKEFEPLLTLAQLYPYPEEFLSAAVLGSGVDSYHPEWERAALMTLHASKGLEFPCVFIPGCSEGLLPYRLFPGQDVNKEEEKRLFYVGMTRSQKYLFLSHAEKRRLRGREKIFKPSPFLHRIQEDLLQKKQENPARKHFQIPLFDE